MENFITFWPTLVEAGIETLYMVFTSVVIAYILGIPLGVLLIITRPDGLMPNMFCNKILGLTVNGVRSIPFLILIVVLIPFTRFLIGTAIGSSAAVVALVIAATPFVARMVEATLSEIDKGVIDVAKSMGASNFQIITKVMIPESIPSLIRGFSITTITLISFSAMAGAVGAGGLGRIAIRYGFQRYQTDVMVITIIATIIMVAIIQFACNVLAARLDKRLR